MLYTPFYDPKKSYQDNFDTGPFGDFSNSETITREGEPTQTFLDRPVYLPFGIPAGPLVNSKYVKAAFEKGFDINVYKTVRTRKYDCHPWPNIVGVEVEGDLTLEKADGQLVGEPSYKEPLSITNSFGVPSPDPDWWQVDMHTAVESAGKGQVMIASFQGTKAGDGNVEAFIQDYVLGARLVKETGAKILEANLSCPNEGTADLLCFDTTTVQRIAEAIKNEIGDTPLLLKLAYFKDNDHLKDYLTKIAPLVDGFSVINTIPSTIVDSKGNQALPGEGRARSGVCGAAIKWAGLEMVERMAKLRDQLELDFAIVGVGGVTQAEDYFEYQKAGSDCVMSATGAMWNPYLAQQIAQANN